MFFYQISTLTTGKDTFTGGALDDMFTAAGAGVVGEAPTLTAGDVLDGGAGNDTLLLDNQGNVHTGLQTVKNIENLKVYESAGWTGDVSEFAGLQNVEVTANGGVELTAGASVTNVALNGAAGATLTGNGITNVSAQNMTTATATNILTVENTTADHTLNVALDKVGTVNADGTAKTILTIADAAATTIALTSNGVENAVQLNGDSKALKNIVIDGKGDLALTASGAAATSIDGSKAEGDLDFTGANGTAALNAATTTIKTGLGDDTFKTGTYATTAKILIDTAAGDDTVVLNAAGKLAADSTITLGDGDDSLTMAFAALTKDLKIDGGTQTADGGDKLIFNTSATFTEAQYALFKADGAVKGFEVVGATDTTAASPVATTLTANGTKLGVKQFYVEKQSILDLDHMLDGSTVTFGAGTLGASTLDMAEAGSTLKLVLESVDTAVADAKAGVTTTKASIINVESTFDLDTTTAQNEGINILKLSADANATVNLTGSQNLTYTNGGAVNQTIKAGTFTGDLTIIGNTGVDEITGGKGDDTFNVGQGNDVLHLSAGGNDIVKLMGKSGAADLTFANVTDTTIDGFTVAAGADQDQLFVSNFASLGGTGTTNWGGAAVPTQTIADNTVYTHKVDANIGDFTGKFDNYFAAGKAFSTTTGAAAGSSGSGVEAVVVIQGKDHSWVLFVDSGSDTTIASGEVKLVATLDVTNGADFTADNFA